MDAVVLAGGLGSRLRTVVADRPKPMAVVNGRPFLEYLLDYWGGQGVSRFILSVGHLKEMIGAHFGAAYRGKAVEYVSEERPLGTGGALLQTLAEKELGSTFLLLNGDTFFRVPMADFSAFHKLKDSDLSIAMRRAGVVGRYGGMAVGTDGRVTDFSERGKLGKWSNGGVYLLNRSMFACDIPWEHGSKVSLEAEILPYILTSGKEIFGFHCDEDFIDIGIPEDYQRAASIVSQT